MHATLIHNTGAGAGAVLDGGELVDAVRALGWNVTALDAARMDEALADPGDVIVVAGGDGTVGRVARRFADTGVPIAIVPTGTANNVARTLGVDLDPRAAIAGLAHATVRDVDLGVARFGDGAEERFIEAFGVGVFAYVMAEHATDAHKELERASQLLAEKLESYEPLHARLDVDGRDVSGHFLLVSVLNLRTLGPALRLAPDAQYDDGELDLVLVRPEERGALLASVSRSGSELDFSVPPFESLRVRRVRIHGSGQWAHIDDRPRALARDVEVRVDPRAVSLLLPKPPARP